MIADGRVSVNGKVLDTPAFKVTGREKILLDGKPVQRPDATRLWRYHKPAGLVTTNKDPEGRPTIFGGLPLDMPRVEGDEGQRRKGLNAFVDKRPGKQRASDKRGPTGRPSTGKPQRPGAPRGGKPGGAGTRSRGR